MRSLKQFRLPLMSTQALGIALISIGASVGCGSDTTFAPPIDPESLYWSLRLDKHAVQLSLTAPNNTIQLKATSFNPYGNEWVPPSGVDVQPTRWYSTDSSKVQVSETGLVTAKAVTSGAIRVIAFRRINNLTQIDTAQIRVVVETTPRTLGSVSIAPTDSAKVAQNTNKLLPIRVFDTNNLEMDGVVAYVTTSDTSIAKPSVAWSSGINATSVTLQGVRPGTALVTATTWVYGVVKTDTFTLRVGAPITGSVNLVAQQAATTSFQWIGYGLNQEVGPGAIVSWVNNSAQNGAPGQPIDVIFDSPSNVLEAPNDPSGGGNILAIPADTGSAATAIRTRYRKFLQVGTYPYRIPQYNIVGTITVRPE